MKDPLQKFTFPVVLAFVGTMIVWLFFMTIVPAEAAYAPSWSLNGSSSPNAALGSYDTMIDLGNNYYGTVDKVSFYTYPTDAKGSIRIVSVTGTNDIFDETKVTYEAGIGNNQSCITYPSAGLQAQIALTRMGTTATTTLTFDPAKRYGLAVSRCNSYDVFSFDGTNSGFGKLENGSAYTPYIFFWDTDFNGNVPSMTWRFPGYGTDDLTIPDPDTYVFEILNLTPGQTYYLDIGSVINDNSSTVSTTENYRIQKEGPPFYTFVATTQNETHLVVPKKNLWDLDPVGTRTWNLWAAVCNEPACFTPLASATTTIKIKKPVGTVNSSTGEITYDVKIPVTPYTGYVKRWSTYTGRLDNPVYTPGAFEIQEMDCGAKPDLTDIGGGIYYGFCKLGNVLFKPSTSSYDNLVDKALFIRKVEPVKTVWSVIQEAEENAQERTTANSKDITLDMSEVLPQTSSSITLLNENSLSNLVGSSTKGQIFTVARYLIWFGVLGTIVATVLL